MRLATPSDSGVAMGQPGAIAPLPNYPRLTEQQKPNQIQKQELNMCGQYTCFLSSYCIQNATTIPPPKTLPSNIVIIKDPTYLKNTEILVKY